MAITRTSLQNVVFAQRIKDGIELAKAGRGEEMNGHGNRVYIANRKGHNVMRIDWRDGAFTVYGEESRDITHMVRKALGMPPAKLALKPRTKLEISVGAAKRSDLVLHKQYNQATVFKALGQETWIVEDNEGKEIGRYSYVSAAELKAFMVSRGN